MSKPLDQALTRLDDYLRGADAPAQEAAYEEDLFSRALSDEAPELAFLADLRRTLREMDRRGTIDLWLTASGVERMSGRGLRLRRFDLDPANPGSPDLSGEFDILITRVPVQLHGVRRLDAEVLSPTGEVVKVMPDITFDASDAAVFACCEADLARVAASVRTITRLWAAEDSGRRLLCEIKYG